MNETKRSVETVECKNELVEEHSTLERRTGVSSGGRSKNENVGLSNANIGENSINKDKENVLSQCSSTKHYNAEVIYAIFLRKARSNLKQISIGT
ncbi:hypothetical protein CR513_45607, partial [Mucuna pruriens]